ncbi:MAG TPA: CUAEP/CCAEP-tail radical SAM protein [Vicinamibacterales bacterium]
MRALLISTYDLGRQPFGLASPAAWLRGAGVEVTCVDTSRDELQDDQIAVASFVAFYLPMHTATRLAGPLIARARRVNPSARVCAYGLYAPLNEGWLREQGVHDVLGPEAEGDLVALVNSQPPTSNSQPSGRRREGPPLLKPGMEGIARLAFVRPDRNGLPPLERYASLQMPDGSRRVAGSTDATRGCKHLCRHCPIVPVYAGQFRVIPVDVVVEDVRAQVAAGAQHMSFGDPDFFNGPTHARRVLERIASEFPGLTYDVTIKVEHLLKHRDLLAMLRDTGCLFITSAVESVDDAVLAKLKKGHTRAGFHEVAASCRAAGIALVPTFVPFTPWTTLEGYVDLLEVIERLELVEHVAPVQLAIRLLVTANSALLDLPDIRQAVGPFDAASLIFPWRHRAARVDALQASVMGLVASHTNGSRSEMFGMIAALARAQAGLSPRAPAPGRGRAVPTVTEPWYCCAEPTPQQLGAI